MKAREEMLMHYLLIKYKNNNIFKKFNEEENIKPNKTNFKEKLMKHAELFFS